ncbi:elongator complex protein 3 [Desulfonatronum sp. SC1]|uniref:elongator complex protein 3 n=1 Tax=Desulfonatronum sp. SC1 TaxID=2109626 RepID=UPI000D32569A|nr:radical SAM protein [Desulfonatronum sp. SC1]PTN37239.1 radical SAM protein [Desulfonatronum sp. SC1]
MNRLRLFHPEPARKRLRIIPVFLPYHGCPYRCIYCAQHLQTGMTSGAETAAGEPALKAIHANMVQSLQQLTTTGTKNSGVAFYGGTFTALPMEWQELFLKTAQSHRADGTITHIRCSTRPDCVNAKHLLWLRGIGLDMVELGIQSFEPDVLRQSRRGYDGETAVKACLAVRKSGLELGVQLMPGLPGSTISGWFRDVDQTRALAPETVRIYPCLVLRGTPLSQAHSEGSYRTWSLPITVWAVSRALNSFWRQGIPVIRIGLAPEGALTPAIQAGPWHPALGHMVKSHALRSWLTQAMTALPEVPRQMYIPRRFAAEFWGHGREHARTWRRLGLTPANVGSWERPYFLVTTLACALQK